MDSEVECKKERYRPPGDEEILHGWTKSTKGDDAINHDAMSSER
jgi:hypothetical protein